jgi:hypothetical protein
MFRGNDYTLMFAQSILSVLVNLKEVRDSQHERYIMWVDFDTFASHTKSTVSMGEREVHRVAENGSTQSEH